MAAWHEVSLYRTDFYHIRLNIQRSHNNSPRPLFTTHHPPTAAHASRTKISSMAHNADTSQPVPAPDIATQTNRGRVNLAILPPELLSIIAADPSLTNRDRKQARLTCRLLETAMTPFIFRRAFISRITADRDGFLSLAASPRLAAYVEEVVWYELGKHPTETLSRADPCTRALLTIPQDVTQPLLSICQRRSRCTEISSLTLLVQVDFFGFVSRAFWLLHISPLLSAPWNFWGASKPPLRACPTFMVSRRR